MSLKRISLLGSIAALALASAAQADDRMKVVTTFTVLADMASHVAGDAAEVVSITKPGAEIHGYQPTPRDIVRAQDADLILWNGMNLELWFEQFLSHLKDVPSVTLSEGIDPISIVGGSYEGKPNPHAWMGLDNALIYIDNIETALSAQDPDKAETYAQNAAAYKDKLRATLEPLRARVAEVRRSTLARDLRGRVLVSCARLRHEGALSLADERRSDGHTAAGARSDRRGEGEQHPGGVL